MVLYKKIEENQQITKRMEHNQIQHTMFLTKLLLNKEITASKDAVGAQGSSNLQAMIKEHLMNISNHYAKKDEPSGGAGIDDFRQSI